MASPYPIRPATEDDLPAVSAVHEHAFHTGPLSGQVRENLDARTEYDRAFTLPVQALGAAYLGGTRLGPMAAAGLVAELRPGTLASLSAALSWDPAPWCPMMF